MYYPNKVLPFPRVQGCTGYFQLQWQCHIKLKSWERGLNILNSHLDILLSLYLFRFLLNRFKFQIQSKMPYDIHSINSAYFWGFQYFNMRVESIFAQWFFLWYDVYLELTLSKTWWVNWGAHPGQRWRRLGCVFLLFTVVSYPGSLGGIVLFWKDQIQIVFACGTFNSVTGNQY